MPQDINAEIIAIGTEILLGELTDTNSVHIARILRNLGINLFYMTSVGDNRQRIADAIRLAQTRATIVITCGGLGPTVDDMTRESVADATNRGLTFHQSLLDQIAERFKSFQSQMTENNRQQAYLPDDAIVIENPVGTAPSFMVTYNGSTVISLPGVPREMKFLLNERVVPYLREKFDLGIIKAHTLRAAGIGESSLDDRLGREMLEKSNPTLGLNAHHGQIDIRITAKAKTESQADDLIAQMEARVREKVGEFIFGTNEDTIESVLVDLLKRRNLALAIVQAGIGDVISSAISKVEGGDEIIVHSDEFDDPQALAQAYSLDSSQSLREIAAAVAKAVDDKTEAYAAVVVVSEPDVDESEDKSESSVVTVLTPHEVSDRVYGFGGRSETARDWVVRWSVSRVWRILNQNHDA